MAGPSFVEPSLHRSRIGTGESALYQLIGYIMKSLSLASGVFCAALALPSFVTAQETPGYFDGVISTLTQNGYREARLVDAGTRRIVAFDAYGSEVSLTIHPRNGSIESWDYVNLRDR
jgi:hypothetical protein